MPPSSSPTTRMFIRLDMVTQYRWGPPPPGSAGPDQRTLLAQGFHLVAAGGRHREHGDDLAVLPLDDRRRGQDVLVLLVELGAIARGVGPQRLVHLARGGDHRLGLG